MELGHGVGRGGGVNSSLGSDIADLRLHSIIVGDDLHGSHTLLYLYLLFQRFPLRPLKY